ncbi:PREDICTED: cyclin-A2-2-like isoform X2 [Populus euphratica]|uniref:B-like cyclin n=1 Tax=Populus euphratica TaxID=75702 RepID=A0AAJ6UCB8_POPEU|nr:PREDICTED: cyclin-A2-2-like isoform X2 [Populus euphratica]
MHCPSSRQAKMNKENATAAKHEEPTTRVTRARAKASGTSVGLFPASKPSFKQDQKHPLRAKTKRAASDENKSCSTSVAGLKHKRRAVLKDVTNVLCENSHLNCNIATKQQTRKQARKCPPNKNAEVAAHISMEISPAQEDVKEKLAEELSKIRMGEAQDFTSPAKLEEKKQSDCHGTREGGVADPRLLVPLSTKTSGVERPLKKESEISEKLDASVGVSVVDIDSNIKDLQLCSLYAPDIFNNIRAKELDQRPSIDYMEKLQHDISPSMRGILIDWLVEVSEEYTLVPDTLYLTVNLIDRFLSQNYIEKQRLQLLGVTCMLIASKYEEICAPRVEEFCFITDNTYTRGEVLKMESQVLNFLHFHLSVPTTKSFLRRFIQAAQASCKVPCVELEFLANYLAELTLVEYNFLKLLPSLIAASVVFLARWTLNQSDHPWNSTLEHYTSYTASELKTTVLALEDLQLNTDGCCLNAIRDKYRQQKFKSVATLTSVQRVSSLF